MNPITVIRKHRWTGREGTAEPHLFVDIKIEPGLIIKGIKIWGKLNSPDDMFQLPQDGVFSEPDLYEIHFPNCRNRFADIAAAGPDFHRLLFEAANQAPMTHTKTFKTEPPKNLEQLTARAGRAGKVPVLVTGLSGREATRYIRQAGLSKPTHRWYEPEGRRHCLSFYFKNEQAKSLAMAAWAFGFWEQRIAAAGGGA
jgi:hypothetical protein